MPSLRDEWTQAKAKVAKHLDMKKVAVKVDLGPLLDKYEAEHKAYDDLMKKLGLQPDDTKQQAAQQKVLAAATKALQATAQYTASLEHVEAHSTGAIKTAASDLSRVLAKIIYPPLRQVVARKMF